MNRQPKLVSSIFHSRGITHHPPADHEGSPAKLSTATGNRFLFRMARRILIALQRPLRRPSMLEPQRKPGFL